MRLQPAAVHLICRAKAVYILVVVSKFLCYKYVFDNLLHVYPFLLYIK